MPRVKVLKGVAHNVGSSFTSLMNYSDDDYSMGHVLRFARQSGMSTLKIDLLSGHGSPATLLAKPVSALPERYSKMFLQLVQSAGSDRELIRSATLKLSYDLQRNRPSPIPGEPSKSLHMRRFDSGHPRQRIRRPFRRVVVHRTHDTQPTWRAGVSPLVEPTHLISLT